MVGYAGSVVRDEDAWVAPGEVAALRPRAAARSVQMLYTFRSAGTGAQLTADLAAVRPRCPPGRSPATVSWLPSAGQTSAEQSVNTPFVVAFALIGLVLAVLIVATVVSGAVVAGYHRIGVLKSIGFTPAQVAAAYLAQLGDPSVAGCAAGAALGNYWVLPELNNSAGASTSAPDRAAVDQRGGAAGHVRAGRAGRAGAGAAGRPAVRDGGHRRRAGPAAGHGYAAHRLASRLRGCPARSASAWPPRSPGPPGRRPRWPRSPSGWPRWSWRWAWTARWPR